MKSSVICMGILIGYLTGCASNCPDIRILEAVKSHDAVLRAKVVEVGQSPGFWSGYFVAIQKVKYAVLEIYKGPEGLSSGQMWISHVLVGHGAAEDKTPGLNPQLFRIGSEAVLFVKESFPGVGKGLFIVGDDPMGISFR